MNSPKNRARLGVEALEVRDAMSWTMAPATLPSGGDRFTITGTDNAGIFRDVDQISRNEVDSYKFTAERSGTYVFEAGAAGASSRIDTFIALYDSKGNLVAFNDDYRGNDSRMEVSNLQAGRTYTLAVTNYGGRPGGLYNLKITPPTLRAYANVESKQAYSFGSATLEGSTLKLDLSGATTKAFYRTVHTVRVSIVDRNGRAVHTGQWVRSFNTNSLLGGPTLDSKTWRIDVSGIDLSKAYRLVVQVSIG